MVSEVSSHLSSTIEESIAKYEVLHLRSTPNLMTLGFVGIDSEIRVVEATQHSQRPGPVASK